MKEEDFECLKMEREKLIHILQEIRIFARELTDFKEVRRYKRLISDYTDNLNKVEEQIKSHNGNEEGIFLQKQL